LLQFVLKLIDYGKSFGSTSWGKIWQLAIFVKKSTSSFVVNAKVKNLAFDT